MTTYVAEKSAVINAPPAQVFQLVADYHHGHPSILPERYFKGMRVLAGGQGAGTRIAFTMDVFGAKRAYEMFVTEPEPGRVLREEDRKAGVMTTFTVDSVNDGAQSRVTIKTTVETEPGLKGWLEKLTTPAIMRRIYDEELNLLAEAMAVQ